MRKLILVLVLVPMVAVLVAACGSNNKEAQPSTTARPSASSAPSGSPSAGATSMEADDFYFDPNEITAQAGHAVTIKLKNTGAASHTFTIDELNVNETLAAGDEKTITFTPTEAGTLTFYCRFHRTQGMEGTIKVSSGSAGG